LVLRFCGSHNAVAMHHNESCRCCQHAPSSVSQSLTEMDFERGIWSAAVNGELERVQKLLSNGLNPDSLDSSHHTALVSMCVVTAEPKMLKSIGWAGTSHV
jgi:hypothetical protein